MHARGGFWPCSVAEERVSLATSKERSDENWIEAEGLPVHRWASQVQDVCQEWGLVLYEDVTLWLFSSSHRHGLYFDGNMWSISLPNSRVTQKNQNLSGTGKKHRSKSSDDILISVFEDDEKENRPLHGFKIRNDDRECFLQRQPSRSGHFSSCSSATYERVHLQIGLYRGQPIVNGKGECVSLMSRDYSYCIHCCFRSCVKWESWIGMTQKLQSSRSNAWPPFGKSSITMFDSLLDLLLVYPSIRQVWNYHLVEGWPQTVLLGLGGTSNSWRHLGGYSSTNGDQWPKTQSETNVCGQVFGWALQLQIGGFICGVQSKPYLCVLIHK